MSSRALTEVEFEALAARLLGAVPKVTDASSLVASCRKLLDAEIVALVAAGTGSEERDTVVVSSPTTELGWCRTHLAEFWGRRLARPAGAAPGYTNEEKLALGGREFADALVAFERSEATDLAERYRIVALQRDGSNVRYSSYHCALAAALLDAYVALKTTSWLVRERLLKSFYAGTLARELLPYESWEAFVERQEPEVRGREELMVPSALLWTAYRQRHDSGAAGPLERFDPWHAAARWVIDGETASTARDWVVTEFTGDGDGRRLLLDFFGGMTPLSPEVTHSLGEAIARGGEYRKAGILGHEIAWRQVEQAMAPGVGEMETKEMWSETWGKILPMLLDQTADLFVEELTGDRSPPSSGHESTIDRSTLRLYLALLLLGSDRLRARYLWLDSPSGDAARYRVPASLRSEYLRNLARYVLSVIGQVEERAGLFAGTGLVSPLEELDSLLYGIDRFVHIELEVEECLDIRGHLTRGLLAEVEHHLARPFYRDHLVHVIDVFLLGHLLLETRIVWHEDEQKRLVEHLERALAQGYRRSEGDWMRQWAVAALLHDVGYRLGRPDLKQRVDAGFDEFFATPWSERKGEEKAGDSDETKAERLQRVWDEAHETPEAEEGDDWLPSGQSPLRDHGVLSALRVGRLLASMPPDATEPREVGAAEPAQGGSVGGRAVASYSASLHAMAHHNLFGERVKFATHPLSCLLRLCDELQEWGRPRVDLEQVVKHLYLTVEGSDGGTLDRRESLERVTANLVFKRTRIGDRPPGVVAEATGDPATLNFVLHYRDAVKAHFDATTTFLSKAFNLQHVDLGGAERSAPLAARLELRFPRPAEYGGLREEDFYALFRLEWRTLPPLPVSASLAEAPPGLSRLETDRSGEDPPGSDDPLDRVAIVLVPVGKPVGWLRLDPGTHRDAFIRFKKERLAAFARRARVGGVRT